MSVLELSAISEGALVALELSLDAGVHVVLGAPADGTRELIAVATGLARPRRGGVRVAGREPHASPEVRRRTASLLAEERLIPAATVSASVARALSIAGERKCAPADVLGAAGLGSWADRPPASLDAAELRAVALAVALARDKPVLVALHEPLCVPGVPRQLVLDRVARLAEEGACVLCTTASAGDGTALSSSLLLLDRGRLVRQAAPLPVELAPGSVPDFVVRSDDPRRLAAELAGEAAVTGVDWDQQQSPGAIRVRGADPAELALAIARVAISRSIHISTLSATLPTLDVVRGASAGLERAAYEQAYRRAQAQARASFRAEPRRGAPGTPLYGSPAPAPAEPEAADGEPPEGGAR